MSVGLWLSIAGQTLGLDAAPSVREAVVLRYGAFVVPHGGPGALLIEVRERPGAFEPVLEREAAGRIRLAGPGRLVLEGAARGELLLDEGRGRLDDVTGLGPIDGLIRAALSVRLPLDGALLMHAALVGDAVLCGQSGAGKSTAARALGGTCDEMVVVRPASGGLELHSTPYWQGRPAVLPCRVLVCLERGDVPSVRGLVGAEAVRELLRHVVRYVVVPSVESAILSLAAQVAARGVQRLVCPEGAAYVPFLTTYLASRGAA